MPQAKETQEAIEPQETEEDYLHRLPMIAFKLDGLGQLMVGFGGEIELSRDDFAGIGFTLLGIADEIREVDENVID